MAFDLVVWKWADGGKPADPQEVVAALYEDMPHDALTRFDMAVFESSLREHFGSVNDDPDGPFLYEVCDYKDVPANWMMISVSWSQVDVVCPQIVEIAQGQHLTVFDPQSGQVYD